MTDPATLLLRSLLTSASLSGRTELSAEEVNGLAAVLGLSDAVVLQAIERLKTDGFVELHWGGRVSLTAAGREQGAGTPGAGAKSINVTNSPNTNVAIDGIAAGQGAVVMSNVAGDLAALLHSLRTLQANPDKPTADAANELAEVAKATLAEVQAPAPDPERGKDGIARLAGALVRFGEVAGKATSGVQAILDLGTRVVGLIGKLWLGV